MSQTISRSELKRIMRMYFTDAKTGHSWDYAFKSFLFYARKKSECFDDDAMIFISEISDVFIRHLDESAEKMEDGEMKRRIKRQIAMVRNEHFSFENVINQLYKEPDNNLEMNKLTREIFVKLGQTILDYLYDVPKKEIKKADFANIMLFHTAVDELLVSFHLAQHGFSSQSIHHSRTVLEIIDLAELFQKDPAWVDSWYSEDIEQYKKYKQFKPAEVRKKLGKKGRDPIYSMMSEMGTHITSYYAKLKAKEKFDFSEKKLKKKVTIKIGGSSEDWTYVSANNFCVYSTSMLLNRIAGNFKKYLSEKEVIDKTLEITEDLKKYFLDGFINFSRQRGKDVTEAEKFIKNIKIDF